MTAPSAKAAHTALPWCKNNNDDVSAISSESGLHVCDVDGYGAKPETNHANSNLIVRAVNNHADLLAALAMLVAYAEAARDVIAETPQGASLLNSKSSTIEFARAAIIKATA